MKSLLWFLALAAAVLVASAQNGGSVTISHDKQGGRPGVTNIGVQQSFGNDKGHISIGAGATKVGGQKWQTNVGVQGQHNIFENKHGQISVGGGVNKFPGQKWQPNVGIQGSFRWKREPQQQNGGSVTITHDKQGGRPGVTNVGVQQTFGNDRGHVSIGAGATKVGGQKWQTNVGVQGQHNIFENKHGQISVGGGVNKFPGQKWQPNVGIQGSFRWKREPQHQNGGSVTITHDKQGGRPGVTNVGVQQTFGNNKGHVTIGADATKVGGQRWQTNVGVQGQHNIFENKHGQISVGGSFNKSPGQKWQPNVGIQGSFRWKREPQPDNQGSVTITHDQRGRGPGVTNVGVQHSFENDKSRVTIGAGASKVGGQRWQTNVGVEGQHKIFENNNGHISVGGSINKYPGQNWQPNVGIQGSFQWKREAVDMPFEEMIADERYDELENEKSL